MTRNRTRQELILTIDVEGYRKTKDGHVEKAVETTLDILNAYQQQITFFVVAEIDEIYPRLVPRIYAAGHEVAVHSYRHRQAELTTVTSFEADAQRCLTFQKKYHAVGFRSPRMHIQPEYYRVLNTLGYRYDSSVYGTTPFAVAGVTVLPVSILPFRRHPAHGIPAPFNLRLLRQAIPFGGGLAVGTFQTFERFFIARYQKTYREPPCLFLHTWQIAQPGSSLPWQFLWQNPLGLPYVFGCQRVLEFFCQNFQLIRVQDYLW